MRTLLLMLLLIALPRALSAQSLDTKLNQPVDFLPSATTVREQLIQVAQHYKIPMGIEWVVRPEEKQVKLIAAGAPTVMALLSLILQAAPDYSMIVRDGVVNVSDNRYTVDSHNFLNLRIGEFSLTKANVFDAQAELRLKIHMTLHPERYVGGFNGGYGYGDPDKDGLDVENISFTGKGLSVREILDRIVSANGNTLWIVNIGPSTMMKNEPFFAQFPTNPEVDFSWRFIPFSKSTAP